MSKYAHLSRNDNAKQVTVFAPPDAPRNFEMVRMSHAKAEVDLSPNTIRKFNREFGLKIYWVGKSAFFSRTELQSVIRTVATNRPPKRKTSKGSAR